MYTLVVGTMKRIHKHTFLRISPLKSVKLHKELMYFPKKQRQTIS